MATKKSYKLIRSKRRTIALAVTADASLIVRAPMSTSLSYIERLVDKKIDWIRRAIARVSSRPRPTKHEYIEGESFLYLGKSYRLTIAKKTDKKLVFRNTFILSAKEKKNARELLIAWYKSEAKKMLTERVDWCARRAGISYKSIKITTANRRWGSCSTSGNLNFSWRLIMAPLSVIDYVVVHELAHLEHKNHSKTFWNTVKVMYPNYEKAKVWLRTNEGTLSI
jgi:predicted metal-dependent hydrolase